MILTQSLSMVQKSVWETIQKDNFLECINVTHSDNCGTVHVIVLRIVRMYKPWGKGVL